MPTLRWPRSALLSSALLAPLAACGDAPRPVEPAAERAVVADPSFAGRVILRGELATREGFLMVSAVPAGARMPLMTMKLALADASPAEDGVRSVPFRLDETTNQIPSSVPPGIELELSVRFDADGMVETKEGDVTVAVPVEVGASGIEVVLGG